MVKVLILEYLSIKETHGYEIQKYIQTSGLSTWTKIKSGSIYYALSKMEKNGEVELVKEETKGSRIRKIYRITDKGRRELNNTLKVELSKDLMPIGTDKYLFPMFIGEIDKEECINIINNHIDKLKEELNYWKYWMNIKVNNNTSKSEKISFEMTITNIENSIKWHEALIEEYDIYVEQWKQQQVMIKNFDFDKFEVNEDTSSEIGKERIEELKEIILNNPEESKRALDELLSLLNSKK